MDIVGFAKGIRKRLEEDRATMDDREKDDEGKYGIRYKTIHDDSRYADKHEQFFLSKEKRDNVFEDWMEGRFWDRIFNTELEYRTPSPNVHDIVKVFKESGKIYEEI